MKGFFVIRMKRIVNDKTRYYILHVSKDLFGNWLLEKIYGSISNFKPTRILRLQFHSRESAFEEFEKCIVLKMKKGYERF